MQLGNLMLAMGFAALVLGTGKDDSSKGEAAHVGHGSSVKAVTATKDESKNAWYYEGQVKDQGRTESAKTISANHEDKVTKTKGHSDAHITHVESSPSKETGHKGKDHDEATKTKGHSDSHTTHVDSSSSKETGHKSKDHGKDDSHHMDSSSSKESDYDSKQYKESSSYDKSYGSDHYEDSGSSKGSYDDSYDYYNNEYKSTVSIGPEETMLKSSSHNDHKSSVSISIGPEETSLPESSAGSAIIYNTVTTSVKAEEHHTMTVEYYTDKKTTKITTRTLFATYATEATTIANIYTQSVASQIIVATSAATPPVYITTTSPATFVASIPSTLATTVPGVFATAASPPNGTVTAPPRFTGGSERLGANSLVAMAVTLVALGWAMI